MAEKLTLGTIQETLDCLNDFWQYGREKGFFDDTYTDWRLETLRALIDQGYTVWLYNNSGRVDGVCMYRIEDLIAPDAKEPEPWMSIGYLCVRAKVLANTPNRMKATFEVCDGAVTEGLKTSNAVGLTAHFEKDNTDLRALVDTWPVVMWEETEKLNRFWMRQEHFIERFDKHVEDSGVKARVVKKS